jgi:hypothetical protein
MWTIGNFHLEIVSRPRPPYFHFTNPNFYDKSRTLNLGQTVTDHFENLRARPRQQCLHRGKILRQSETAKTQLFFDGGVRSGPFARNQALTLIRLARNLTGKQIKGRRSCGRLEISI